MFLLVFVVLQWAWDQARGTAFERAVIDMATVAVAVSIINVWTPDVQAGAVGAHIKASGGGIHVLNGCEGTEVLFLLIAALLTYPLSWRWRCMGIVAGVAWVFVLNQLRLMALFYSYRHDRALFDQLHGLVAPMVLIALSVLFMALIVRADERGGRT